MITAFEQFIIDGPKEPQGPGRFFTKYQGCFEPELMTAYIGMVESMGKTEPTSEKVGALFKWVNVLVDTIANKNIVSLKDVDMADIKHSMFFKFGSIYCRDNPSQKSCEEFALLIRQTSVLTHLSLEYFIKNNKAIREAIAFRYDNYFIEALQYAFQMSDSTKISNLDEARQKLVEESAAYKTLPKTSKDLLSQIFSSAALVQTLINNVKNELETLKETCKNQHDIELIDKAITQIELLESNLVSSVKSLRNNQTSLSDANKLINSTVDMLFIITPCYNDEKFTPMVDDSSSDKAPNKEDLKLSEKIKKLFREYQYVKALQALKETLLQKDINPALKGCAEQILIDIKVQKNKGGLAVPLLTKALTVVNDMIIDPTPANAAACKEQADQFPQSSMIGRNLMIFCGVLLIVVAVALAITSSGFLAPISLPAINCGVSIIAAAVASGAAAVVGVVLLRGALTLTKANVKYIKGTLNDISFNVPPQNGTPKSL